MEAQWLILPHARIEDEASLLDELGAARVAGVEDGHVVGFGQSVYRIHEALEVRLCVDVFFAMRGQEDVAAVFETEALEDRRAADFFEIGAKDLGHRGAGDVGALFGDALAVQIATRVF